MTSTRLPDQRHELFLTDGGIETDLIYRRHLDLPHFAAFPLLDTSTGRAALRNYYTDYIDIAAANGSALMLESPTWRANPDWGTLLGYPALELNRLNKAGITLMRDLQTQRTSGVAEVIISGSVGPRYDGYATDACLQPEEAANYHRPQLQALAKAGADMASAYTITHTGEAIGIVRAARDIGLPIAVSFTVETDGRLPSGITLAAAITEVDAAAPPDYFLVNCAHPTHIQPALANPGPWIKRIVGVRANASRRSHAEFDQATALDDGDPAEFANDVGNLVELLPALAVVGGCCGTDSRHIGALAAIRRPPA
ncbi:homocysteine S-methyltransferase family protein [Leekyejoonella antrihumi]|uniref:Homocysteine S-methyltransferase n=1 Tax=Leekyejoonella antrihumi TaxID=1660198 RepID=A0A563E272_9MICO|nr:homocysteine S-methyltransferase family protein [Leekyejoonella antrihumi]TWP36626.1 homocysteine S-methyltransferase [Leekyejoonella antrihumi]